MPVFEFGWDCKLFNTLLSKSAFDGFDCCCRSCKRLLLAGVGRDPIVDNGLDEDIDGASDADGSTFC